MAKRGRTLHHRLQVLLAGRHQRRPRRRVRGLPQHHRQLARPLSRVQQGGAGCPRRADADIAHALLQKAKGFTHTDVKILQIEGGAEQVEYNRYFPPDTQAALFWLRNRRRKQWRELIQHEHTSVTDEKLRELEEAGIRARNAHRR